MLKSRIQKWARRYMKKRPPDVVIGPVEDPYLRRWWVIPRNKFFNIYLHEVLTSDDDRALHDHPWVNMSYIVEGAYDEHTILNGGINVRKTRREGSFKFRLPSAAHRLELRKGTNGGLRKCVTIFVTGPRVRSWGFHCPKGWVHWRDFCLPENKGQVGAGCGEPD